MLSLVEASASNQVLPFWPRIFLIEVKEPARVANIRVPAFERTLAASAARIKCLTVQSALLSSADMTAERLKFMGRLLDGSGTIKLVDGSPARIEGDGRPTITSTNAHSSNLCGPHVKQAFDD